MARSVLRHVSADHCIAERPLHHRLMQMMPPTNPGFVNQRAARSEHVAPGPLSVGVRILPKERRRNTGASDAAPTIMIELMLLCLQMPMDRRQTNLGQRRAAIFPAFPTPNDDLATIGVDVLHPQGEAFEKAKPASI